MFHYAYWPNLHVEKDARRIDLLMRRLGAFIDVAHSGVYPI